MVNLVKWLCCARTSVTYTLRTIPQCGKDKVKDKINYLSKYVMVLYEIVELIKMFSLHDKTRCVAYVLYLISFIMCIKRVYTMVKSWKIYSHTFASHSTLIMNPCVQCYINNLYMRVYNGAWL